MWHDFHDFEPDAGPEPTVQADGVRVRLPLHYHENEVFTSIHPIGHRAACDRLPSAAIRPVRWVDGRALLALTAFRYRAVTWLAEDATSHALAPYGELSAAIVVTTWPAPFLLPLVRSRRAGFVLHLPVTTPEACRLGRRGWGFPKFVADLEFAESPRARSVQLSEGGATVLTLTVRPGALVLPDHGPLVAYSVRNGRLLETALTVDGRQTLRLGGGELELGRHPVADDLLALDVSPHAVASFSYLQHRAVLPAGRDVGDARDYAGYRGAEESPGRFTCRYPTTAPLDLSHSV